MSETTTKMFRRFDSAVHGALRESRALGFEQVAVIRFGGQKEKYRVGRADEMLGDDEYVIAFIEAPETEV